MDYRCRRKAAVDWRRHRGVGRTSLRNSYKVYRHARRLRSKRVAYSIPLKNNPCALNSRL